MEIKGAHIAKIEQEYFMESGGMIEQLKKLPTHERRILIAYAELGSLDKTAKLFNVSKSYLSKIINEIKGKFERKQKTPCK